VGDLLILYGNSRLLTQQGSRITRARVLLNNNLPIGPDFAPWFADPTPYNHNDDFTIFRSYSLPIEDHETGNVTGYLNNGRTWTALPPSPAANRTDLLTICLHEISHALGLDGQNDELLRQLSNTQRRLKQARAPLQQNDDATPLLRSGLLDLTPPRPFAQPDFFFIDQGPHLASPSGPDRQPLTYQYSQPGIRQLVSGLDALLMAQITLVDAPQLCELPLQHFPCEAPSALQ